VKNLSDSNTALQQELEDLKVAAQAVVDIVEIPDDDAEALLSLAGKLRKVPQCFLQYVSKNYPSIRVPRTRVGEVLLATDTTGSAKRGREVRLQRRAV